MKKILLLFLSAIASFLMFSYIDEYENLIAPLFSKDKGGYAELLQPVEDEGRTGEFLVNFNNMLSAAYLSSDPAKVSELPLSDELKREIMEEIDFLKRKDMTMDMILKELTISKIDRLSPVAMQVRTREKVGIRYLTGYDGASSVPYSESEHGATYLLTVGSNGLMVSSFEIISVKE